MTPLLAALLAAAACGAAADSPLLSFDSWARATGEVYGPLESAFRARVFAENLAFVTSQNAQPDRTVELGMTVFAALTTEEFAERFTGIFQQGAELHSVRGRGRRRRARARPAPPPPPPPAPRPTCRPPHPPPPPPSNRLSTSSRTTGRSAPRARRGARRATSRARGAR
jgi:hypothetical protein